MTAPDGDGSSEDRHDIARLALYRLGGTGPVEVVRDGASLLVHQGDVVVRVRPEGGRTVAEREVAIAQRLIADRVPVTPLLGELQPWTIEGHVVTGWRWCPAVRPARSADLGALVGALRTGTSAGGIGELTPFDPLGHILDVVGEDDDPASRFVRDQVAELTEPFADASVDDPFGFCVVHGDLHRENVVVAAEGALLTDLELGGWGPASYDTAAAVVAVRRYGAPAEGLDRFLDASGADPRGWPGFEVMVTVSELWVAAWAVSVAHLRTDWATEADLRVASLRDGTDRTWHLH
ncbi:MAG: phosphotransferase [Aquihabitans sp.]